MPWRCPACETIIKQHDGEQAPRAGARYRCHVCRLELILSDRSDVLMIAPFEVDHRVMTCGPTGQRPVAARRVMRRAHLPRIRKRA
jgi:hypothetical protein